MAKASEKERIIKTIHSTADLIERGEWQGIIIISGNDGKLHNISMHTNREAIAHLLDEALKYFNKAFAPMLTKLHDAHVTLTEIKGGQLGG